MKVPCYFSDVNHNTYMRKIVLIIGAVVMAIIRLALHNLRNQREK